MGQKEAHPISHLAKLIDILISNQFFKEKKLEGDELDR